MCCVRMDFRNYIILTGGRTLLVKNSIFNLLNQYLIYVKKTTVNCIRHTPDE